MDETRVRQIFKEEFEKNYRSGNPKIPPHSHNGIDNIQVRQKDIIQNTKFLAFGVATSGLFTLNVLTNPSTLTFYGFAANNAGGGGATKKASLSGTAQLGNCLLDTQGSTGLTASYQKVTIIQANSSFYVDTTGPTFSVHSDSLNIASTPSAEAVATVVSFNNNSITISVTLQSGWEITGGFIVT